MNANLREQLRRGKMIKVKHPEYAFTIHAELKMEDGQSEPTVKFHRVNLPTAAKRGEKYLLKLVQIYAFEVMAQNLLDSVLTSQEYQKVLANLRNLH